MTRFMFVLAFVSSCRSKDTPPAPTAAPVTAEAPAPVTPSTTKPTPAPRQAAGARPASVEAGAVRPPSTGKEMPADSAAITPEQAKQVVAQQLEHIKQPNPNCSAIADALMVALPSAYPKMTAEAVPGYQALQKCALAANRWRASIQAGVALLAAQPDNFTVAQIVRALAELGEYDRALAAAKQLGKQFPAARESLVGAMSYVYCKAEAWKECAASAEAALALFAKQHLAPTSEGMIINRILRDSAWIVIGKAKPALDDLNGLTKLGATTPAISKLKGEAEVALERGFYLEAVPLPQIATGVYHLLGKPSTGALLTLKLREHAGRNRSFRIEAEIPGVTERASTTFVLAKNATTVQLVNPPLKIDFDASKVRGPRPSQLVIKLVESDAKAPRAIIDQTVAIDVLPRDYLPLRRKVGADSTVDTFGFLAAWVTPNDKAVDGFLAAAKSRAPGHNFVGEQDATLPQIKALYDELKAKGMSYVMDPSVTSEQAMVQRTRLPADVLASTNAQCLEGTLLFATLMESIGVKPIVVVVPGHAFVGWHTVPKDNTKGAPMFVETTMVGGYSFEQAVEVATRRVQQEADNFKTGASSLVDIAELRTQGFTAQPL